MVYAINTMHPIPGDDFPLKTRIVYINYSFEPQWVDDDQITGPFFVRSLKIILYE